MGEVGLRLDGVSKRYGARWVIRGLDLEVASGQALVVSGPNGSGKSTLLRIISGLLPPTDGHVWIGSGGSEVDIRLAVGLASPEQALYGALTGIENYLFFACLRGLPRSRRDADQHLTELGLGGRGDDRADAYSTGMKQRLRLAIATQHNPPVLLLDEPGSGLDESGRKVIDAILSSQRQRGLALVATNDPEEYAYGDFRLQFGV